MTAPAPEVRAATVRTLVQNIGLDAGLAVVLVVLPAIQAEHIAWWPLLVSVGKTAAVTVLTGVLHWLRARRSTE